MQSTVCETITYFYDVIILLIKTQRGIYIVLQEDHIYKRSQTISCSEQALLSMPLASCSPFVYIDLESPQILMYTTLYKVQLYITSFTQKFRLLSSQGLTSGALNINSKCWYINSRMKKRRIHRTSSVVTENEAAMTSTSNIQKPTKINKHTVSVARL